MATAITYDREPGFIADLLEINGETICVLNPKVFTDDDTRSLVASWMRGRGAPCGACLGCPVGVMQQGEGGADAPEA